MLFLVYFFIQLGNALQKALAHVDVGVAGQFEAEPGAEVVRSNLVVGLSGRECQSNSLSLMLRVFIVH